MIVPVLPGQTYPQTRGAPNHHALSPTYFLIRSALIQPESIAIHHVNRDKETVQKSYEQMSDRAKGLAYFLKSKGCRRVGILAPNTPAFLEAIYGISAAGGVNVAINYRLKADDVTYIFTHADVDAIIVDEEYLALLDSFRTQHSNVTIIVDKDRSGAGPFDLAIDEGLQIDRQSGGQGWRGLAVQPDSENDLIALSYTSGTTARPKGVEYIHRGAYLSTLAAVAEYGLSSPNEPTRYLWTLPMFHAMGWCCVWAVTAARGTHYCLRTMDYTLIWQTILQESITHLCAAPTVVTSLCNSVKAQQLSKPVKIVVAGSPPPPTVFKQMIELNFEPIHVYGMTETYGPITRFYIPQSWNSLPEDDRTRLAARQGHGLLTTLEVRVVKANGSTNTLVDVQRNGSDIGEIVFTGNLCARGYYKNNQGTKDLFAGGALHSGDLAVWHPDGAIQIVDRSKDIIISGGENISSVAVESLLLTHPAILEAGVIAVPDAIWGERPKAFVTFKEKHNKLSGSDILAWARYSSGLSKFMIPREVEILPDLPKSTTGKIQKQVLRKMARKVQQSKI